MGKYIILEIVENVNKEDIVKIGGYTIKIGGYFWMHPLLPIQIYHFLWFWLFKEARPTDIHRKQKFPLGTQLNYEERCYHYYKAGANIKKDNLIRIKDCGEAK